MIMKFMDNLVTIVIPVYNEKDYIIDCLKSLLEQDYKKIEILVVDGGSTDGTIEILVDFMTDHPQIRLINNSKKYTVHAFNLGILNSDKKAEYITFLNCHAIYSSTRLSRLINYLNEYDVDVAGGVSIPSSRNDSYFGLASALILRSPFSTGSRFRVAITKPAFVDTASGCLYKKSIFKNIGMFNEDLICSQDLELNKRIISKGGRILLVPNVITHYKSRGDIKSFLIHTYRNGKWAIMPFLYSKIIPVSLRHVVPIIALLIFIFLSVLSSLGIISLSPLIFIIVLYFLLNIFFSIKISLAHNKILLLPILMFSFFSFHMSYMFGSLLATIKIFFMIFKSKF